MERREGGMRNGRGMEIGREDHRRGEEGIESEGGEGRQMRQKE